MTASLQQDPTKSVATAPPLIEVEDLQTSFIVGEGQVVRAVDGVSFVVNAGETLAIVGESGSGKSVTSLSIMRLLPKKIGQISRGAIRLRGRDLVNLTDREMRAIRGNDIGMIFQEPMTSLNPVHTIGTQIAEVVIQHTKVSKREAHKRAIEMLEVVGIPEPVRRADQYPHEMSGGMRQRAMIAMALACEPSVLIADEPTTALDVTIQAQILDLMRTLQEKLGMAIVFITHDLGVVSEMAKRVVVMYAGQVVETGTVEEIFTKPLMPYTSGLMQSIPRMDPDGAKTRLKTIPGYVPLLTKLPSGCRFRTRCAFAEERCAAAEPPLEVLDSGRSVRCIRWKELDLQTRPSA
jgi:peptide/nickel transport system ATP-binding protein/oligopeptide transport system ATP-binding protein